MEELMRLFPLRVFHSLLNEQKGRWKKCLPI